MPAYGIDSFTTKPNLNKHEADDFMKLGDIKGEIVRGDGDEIIYGGGGHNYLDALTYREDGAGRSTFESDALINGGQDGFTCEPASDIWTNGGASTFNDSLLGFTGSGIDLRSENHFVFEPMDVMPSLGESIDPGLDAAGGFQPHDVTGVQIGEPPEPKLWLQMLG